MNLDRAFFSIIIPIYNTAQDYLDCCLGSLTNQTFPDFEIILIDDGSHKSCAKLCDEYAERDSRIRVIHQENQGVSAARNNGIKAAQADWILFVDADDWLEPDACARLKEHLEANPCDILQFRAVKEYSNRQEELIYGYEFGRLYETSDPDTREFLYRRAMRAPTAKEGWSCPAYYSWDKVIRRQFLIDNELQYPLGVPKSEDKVFFLYCFEKMERMFCVDDTLYHYRINSASACNRYSEKADSNCMQLATLLMEIAKRMDQELGTLKAKPDYDRITQDCKRFLFGILSDVLFLKYYHPEYPRDKKSRSGEVRKFLHTEPFRSSIRECRYSELSSEAKLKKLLLSVGLVSVFCYIRKIHRSVAGKTAG